MDKSLAHTMEVQVSYNIYTEIQDIQQIYLINSLSEVDIITDELLEELMPWNDNLPKELRIVAPKSKINY